jgi:hypothetical protein
MGIDLQIFASNFREKGGEVLATASLRFDRDQRLLSQFAASASPCLVRPLPQGLKVGHYEDKGLTFDELDRYGKPLTYTTSTDIQRVKLPPDLAPWNHAILAFMTKLPPETRLVLYWC